MGKTVDEVDSQIMEIFKKYSWPGNVRELQNVIERMLNIVHTNKLTLDLIPTEIIESTSTTVATEVKLPRDIERQMILEMMLTRMSKRDIAKKMKIARSTLYRKLAEYKIIAA
jgi:two-component system response regulator HydG